MTISPVGAIGANTSASGTSLTFTLAPGAVNNVLCLFLKWNQTNNRTASVATASGGILWTPAAAGRVALTAGGSIYMQGFYGVAQSVTSRVTTMTWSGTATQPLFAYQQFHTDIATPVWSEVDSDTLQSATSVTSMPGPALNCGAAGGLYTAFWFTGGTGNTTGTPGFTFQNDAGSNVYGYGLNVSGTEQPDATQTSGTYDSYGLSLNDGSVAPSDFWVPPTTGMGFM